MTCLEKTITFSEVSRGPQSLYLQLNSESQTIQGYKATLDQILAKDPEMPRYARRQWKIALGILKCCCDLVEIRSQ